MHKEKSLFSNKNSTKKKSFSGSNANSGKLFKTEATQGPLFKKDPKACALPSTQAVEYHKKTPPIKVPQADPLDRLNEDQYDAAVVKVGKNLIIASAGTGKTSTIMGRISFLLSKGISPEEILLLTFTSKAAAEMSERIGLFFGDDVAKKVSTGTFHSTGLRKVKTIRPNYVLKLPKEAALLFKSVFDHRQIPVGETPPLSAATIYAKYGLFLNTACDGETFEDWMAKTSPEQEANLGIYAHICDEFEGIKQKEHFYDFNDILMITKEYYLSNKCPFHEIIVDEYQDTNTLQSSLLDAMNPPSLYCVGDYDQSIYAFNGADIGIIGSFSERHKGAKVSTLTKNYRSSKPILALAERVIKHNKRLYPKKLEVMMKESPHEPQLFRPDNIYDQYKRVASLIAQDGLLGETAVIYRSNSSGDGMEAALKEADIKYIRKGEKSFFESKDILALISMYKIAIGDASLPSFLQMLEISPIAPGLGRIVHHTLKEFGRGSVIGGAIAPIAANRSNAMPTKAENFQMGVVNMKINPSKSHIGSTYKKHLHSHPLFEYESISQKRADAVADLFDFIKSAKDIWSPYEMVVAIEKSDLLRTIWTNYASIYCRDKSGAIMEANLKEYIGKLYGKINVIKKIAGKKKTHKAFLSSIETQQEKDADPDSVQLLSVHASKGLEFENVHLVDLIHGTFPNVKLMNNGGGGIDEERRLFYVAVTRAKHRLYLYSPMGDKSNKSTVPSQFLMEGGLIQA
jgi:DNA helicase II / ATP-dependent DNA helicase PcrA